MDRTELENAIIGKVDFEDGWGSVCNTINDVAESCLSRRQFENVLIAQNKDFNECDGSDFVVFNGRYFDWKEFTIRAKEIVKAFLHYFNTSQLELILKKL